MGSSELISYIVTSIIFIGIAYVVGASYISVGFRSALHKQGALGRFLTDLVECPACFSFHLGWFFTLLGWTPFPKTVPGVFFAAFFYAGVSATWNLAAQVTRKYTGE